MIYDTRQLPPVRKEYMMKNDIQEFLKIFFKKDQNDKAIWER